MASTPRKCLNLRYFLPGDAVLVSASGQGPPQPEHRAAGHEAGADPVASRLARLAKGALARIALAIAVLAAPVTALAAPYAALVMDARTGEVLHAVNADARLHPASLTKMMTLYIAFEAIRRGEISLDSQVVISAKAASEPPSKLGLRAGQRVQLRYLIRAAAVKSANDAATAIAEAIEGSEAAFARRMNRTARALGMTNSQFRNAHGLTQAGHYSSARDMTILGRHLFYDYPDYYPIFSRRTADAGLAQVANTNSRFLDGYPGADGIKTGFTSAAGFNLTASAERGSKRIIATVFGGTSTVQRNAKMIELMDLGFARAPERARVVKPALPRYDRLPPEPAQVAEAEAAPDGSGRVAAGRILRVTGAVTRSPRPRPRPGAPSAEPPPDALIAAIEGSVSAAIAEVAVTAAAPPPEPAAQPEATAAAAGPVPPPRPRPEGQPEAAAPDAVTRLAEASAPAAAEPDADPAAAIAADVAADVAAGVAAEVAAEVAAAGAAAAVAQAADARAAPPDVPDTAGADSDPLLAGVAPRPRPDPQPADAAAPVGSEAGFVLAETAVPPPQEEQPQPAPADTAAVAEPPAAPVVLSDAMPAPDLPAEPAAVAEPPAAAVVAAAAVATPPIADPVLRPEPETPEVVVRMSTSGGRQWGVAIGQYRARAEAERALITLALADMTGLGGALRRVNQRSGVWEASFMGLSADQAALACRRMEARGMACRTIGP